VSNKVKIYICLVLFLFGFSSLAIHAETVFTPLKAIISNSDKYIGSFVSVRGLYAGWKDAPGRPPVTRSDWVIKDNSGNAIYCTGKLPENLSPGSYKSYGKPITVLAKVKKSSLGKAYLQVQEIKLLNLKVEKMVSVSQILFDPFQMQGKYIGLLGVLAKGYGVKGDRMYLLADPSGAIKLGRLPKLYPKGTILHIRGIIHIDENGLPFVDNVEIVSARVD
jgi:hypothetical protein